MSAARKRCDLPSWTSVLKHPHMKPVWVLRHEAQNRKLIEQGKKALYLVAENGKLLPEQAERVAQFIDPAARTLGDDWELYENKERIRQAYYRRLMMIPPEKRTPRMIRRLQIRAQKEGVTANWVFFKAIGGYYDSEFFDGIDPSGPSEGPTANSIYIGIPAFTVANSILTTKGGFTVWPYDPRTITRERPSAWPSAEAAGYYYVDATHPNATATGYGCPDNPRASFPAAASVVAGDTIIYSGTGHTYDQPFFYRNIRGTAEQPVFIRCDENLVGDARPNLTGNGICVEGSSHIIFENIRFDGGNAANAMFYTCWNGSNPLPTEFITLRKSTLVNAAWKQGGGGIVAISADDRNGGTKCRNICIYDNTISGNGVQDYWDYVTGSDLDHHGVNVTMNGHGIAGHVGECSLIWVIKNHITNCSGNAVQTTSIGGQQVDWRDMVHDVYIGGNYGAFNRECPFWTKRSSRIVISENISEGSYLYKGGNGQNGGWQYGPTDVWLLCNEYFDSIYGIQQTDTGAEAGGEADWGRLYVVGNILHGFLDGSGDKAGNNDSWRYGAAFSFPHGYSKRWLLLNSVYGAINGYVDNGNAYTYASNNIFQLRQGSIGNNVEGQFYQAIANTIVTGDIWYKPTGTWQAFLAGTTYTSVAAVNALANYSSILDSDPLFSDPENDDFSPAAGSPAIGAGSWVGSDGTDVGNVFNTEFGINVKFDRFRNARLTASKGALEISV